MIKEIGSLRLISNIYSPFFSRSISSCVLKALLTFSGRLSSCLSWWKKSIALFRFHWFLSMTPSAILLSLIAVISRNWDTKCWCEPRIYFYYQIRRINYNYKNFIFWNIHILVAIIITFFDPLIPRSPLNHTIFWWKSADLWVLYSP